QMRARIKILSEHNIGCGITVSRIGEDDQLQALHKRLRGMPSYLYLNRHEQRLEATAHAYLRRYPAGTRAQLHAIPAGAMDEEDEQALKEVRRSIRKVIETRGLYMDDVDDVLERLAELQDLQAEVKRIDNVLEALAEYKPDYARLLRLHVIEDRQWDEVSEQMCLSKDSFYRMKRKALREYAVIGR
uniref:RNA polymerase subunit sigma-24 n=1 Tax=Cohnella sp. GbtcB17 TaxID=2824762 RepID=UPI0020C71471